MKYPNLPPKGWKAESAWSPAGRAQDNESLPVKDRRSTTVPRNQLS